MGIRVGWLPTGTEGAEDARQANQAGFTQSSLNVAMPGAVPGVAAAVPFALTSTGSLSCSVSAGQAVVVPGATSTQGAYPVTVDASSGGLPTVSFSAGSALARTDVIYLRVQDTAEDGSGQTRGQIAVQQGTSGGGVPAVPTGAIALWNVPVGASASSINFATATAQYALTVALGGVVPAASSAQPAAAYKGQVRARNDLTFTNAYGPLEAYDGATWQPAVPAVDQEPGAWTSYTPTWTGASGNPVPGNAVITGWYRVKGKTCDVRVAVRFGSTTTFGAGVWGFSLPFPAKFGAGTTGDTHVGGAYGFLSGTANYVGVVTVGVGTPSASVAQIVSHAAVTGWGSTVPNTWNASSGSYVAFSMRYETT